jgi:hypothetical protein
MPIYSHQFLQSLVDRITARHCSDSNINNVQLHKDISALDPSNIKSNDFHYGELEVRIICRRCNVDEIQAIQGLRDFTENSESVPESLKSLLTTVSTLPCSTAECERGFSLINNTELRASLLFSNVSNLMFIKANGPPIDQFQLKKHVRSWLINQRSATDVQSKTGRRRDASRPVIWDVFSEK